MWMSSGGTSSVVHVDSVDNIICVYRGLKQFILIDPAQLADDQVGRALLDIVWHRQLVMLCAGYIYQEMLEAVLLSSILNVGLSVLQNSLTYITD